MSKENNLLRKYSLLVRGSLAQVARVASNFFSNVNLFFKRRKSIYKNLIGFFKKIKRAVVKNRKKTESLIKKKQVALEKSIKRKKKKTIRFYKKSRKQLDKKIKKIRKKIKKIKKSFAFHQLKNKASKNFKKYKKRHAAHLDLLKMLFSRQMISIYLSLAATILILGSAWWTYVNIFQDLPSPTDLTDREQILTTRILDRNGTLLFRIYEDENRTYVPLSQISQYMINATIAIEDQSFYNHQGFSIRGISRAIWANLTKNRVEGGSTITQQLVKNRLLDSERTLQRKIKELIISILVEGTYSKEEILQMYLNQVSYGGSTYGVEEAAWRYFNKPATELNLAESSLLAGLPAAPSVYSPFGPNPELSFRRQEEVLRRMVEDGYISIDEAYHARQKQLDFRQDVIDIQAPHFVMYVKKLLAEKFGEETLNKGGLEVRTSLDLNLQQQAQDIVTTEVQKVERLGISNGAALVTNPKTGEILAMVGSINYFDFENDGQVNVAVRPRQPGSSIKPLVYALAFESGRKPWDKIEDTPITYQIPGSTPYSPRNYDGTFRGTVSLRQALASSLNVPAVKLLASLGVQNMVEKGQEMGITTWTDSSRFGLSLALGAGEVLMTDLSTVFGTFANDGYMVQLDPLIEVRDHEDNILYRNPCFNNPEECRQIQTIRSLTAYQINDILSDNIARASTFGTFSQLYIPQQQVAVKTGTTNSMRDNWTIGYTSDRLVATWVGNNDNSSMSFVASGVTGASPIWNQIMRMLLDEQSPHSFLLPKEYKKVRICAPTGTLPCPECPLVVEEIFLEGEEPTQACNWRYFRQQEEEFLVPGERSNIL